MRYRRGAHTNQNGKVCCRRSPIYSPVSPRWPRESWGMGVRDRLVREKRLGHCPLLRRSYRACVKGAGGQRLPAKGNSRTSACTGGKTEPATPRPQRPDRARWISHCVTMGIHFDRCYRRYSTRGRTSQSVIMISNRFLYIHTCVSGTRILYMYTPKTCFAQTTYFTHTSNLIFMNIYWVSIFLHYLKWNHPKLFSMFFFHIITL